MGRCATLGLAEIKGFMCSRGTFIRRRSPEVTLMGMNVPIRMGDVTVLPGDVVLSDPDGITFIPAQLAEKVADESEFTHYKDDWGHSMLREGKVQERADRCAVDAGDDPRIQRVA